LRRTLVAALVSCADCPLKSKARRFLLGLSADELQFLAEYLGCCILESTEAGRCSRAQLARRIAEFQSLRQGRSRLNADQEHKMILLLEFLCLSGLRRFAVRTTARQAS
jgi:hypothetical protein